jgi:alkanesulfonate monooxygenase SsuD/methylene tetrahydromethanopterin reductase-like flavin-dependent oxidoreductase (luciferase family)
VKLGISLPMFTADVRRPLAAAARAAAAGYDGAFAPDHLFPPGAPDRPALEPFTVLSAVAVAHPGLHVGTLVSRASLRPVGLVAKLGAALDQLSGGKAILGLGAGDAVSRPEHEMFGIPFSGAAERVAVLGETAEALRGLFAGDGWTGGAHVPPIAGPILPPGAPALWIGGRSSPVIATAARAADGWNGWGIDAEAFEAAVHELRRLADGRFVVPTWGGIVLVGDDEPHLQRLREDRRARGLTMDLWQGTVDDLRRFADRLATAGCEWIVTLPVGEGDRVDVVASALLG